MTKPISVVKPEELIENKMTIYSFFQQSYGQAKKQITDGMIMIRQEASFLKTELSGLYDKAGACFSSMLLPGNNFLKEPAEIESEMLREIKEPRAKLPAGNIIPIEIALLSPMEENY